MGKYIYCPGLAFENSSSKVAAVTFLTLSVNRPDGAFDVAACSIFEQLTEHPMIASALASSLSTSSLDAIKDALPVTQCQPALLGALVRISCYPPVQYPLASGALCPALLALLSEHSETGETIAQILEVLSNCSYSAAARLALGTSSVVSQLLVTLKILDSDVQMYAGSTLANLALTHSKAC